MKQAPPFCVQIELTEGCNLRCSFCGLSGIRGKDNDFKFMSLSTAHLIAQEIRIFGWNSRIEFAMHGEPTMNPDVVEIIDIFRTELPKAYLLMESNGGGLVGNFHRIKELFDAGLNTLALDQYEGISLVPKIVDKIYAAPDSDQPSADVEFFRYPSCGPKGNPHQRNRKKRLVVVAPIDTSTKGTHATLNNHCGAGAPLDFGATGKRCAKPFREMSFRHDGGVAICCNDWRGRYPIGNIHDSSLGTLWHSERMEAARRRLYRGQRDFAPCLGCSALSYRVGLLPDAKGKEDLPPPTLRDVQTISMALREGPMTTPIIRPWEKEHADID